MKTKAEQHWRCVTCEQDVDNLKDHMQEAHNIDITQTKGTRTMIMHLDARDYHRTGYSWKIGSVELAQEVICPRDRDDPMWSGG